VVKKSLPIILGVVAINMTVIHGCHLLVKREPVEVKIPVPVRVAPPQELLEGFKIPVEPFTDPKNPKATSCLTKEGEREIKELLLDIKTRIDAWQIWATEEISEGGNHD